MLKVARQSSAMDAFLAAGPLFGPPAGARSGAPPAATTTLPEMKEIFELERIPSRYAEPRALSERSRSEEGQPAREWSDAEAELVHQRLLTGPHAHRGDTRVPQTPPDDDGTVAAAVPKSKPQFSSAASPPDAPRRRPTPPPVVREPSAPRGVPAPPTPPEAPKEATAADYEWASGWVPDAAMPDGVRTHVEVDPSTDPALPRWPSRAMLREKGHGKGQRRRGGKARAQGQRGGGGGTGTGQGQGRGFVPLAFASRPPIPPPSRPPPRVVPPPSPSTLPPWRLSQSSPSPCIVPPPSRAR